jgi:hypothetical protein
MKLITFILSCFLYAQSFSAETIYTIVLQNHRFNPSNSTIPAGKKVKLLVVNKDASIDEFHSDDLGVEKIISGNSKAIINIGPLKPGRYSFMGEFNATTAQGVIIAK